MEFLILCPPVATPSETPSGAFLLASGLSARGHETALLDLNLEFYWAFFESHRSADLDAALDYLMHPGGEGRRHRFDGYLPERHRGATGVLHKKLCAFSTDHPGWQLSLMDIEGPAAVHDPAGLLEALAKHDPFTPLYDACLNPVLDQERPKRVLISLAYLSQLPATLSLVHWLKRKGVTPTVGGSLASSMARTAKGLDHLASFLPPLDLGDGLGHLGGPTPEDPHLLDRLSWPRLLSKRPYITCRPILPLTLSTGCFWNRCLFCPDRDLPRYLAKAETLQAFLESAPPEVIAQKPLIHLLDSAMPPAVLRRFLPVVRNLGLPFYGFARPSHHLLKDDLLFEAAESGCRMVQLGVESGSKALLDRFNKGLVPDEARKVLRAAAQAGIRTYAYMLFGLPGETAEDWQLTLDLLAEESASIDFLNLSLFNLPRDCELWHRASEFGMEVAADRNDYPLKLYQPFTCNGVPPRVPARKFIADCIQAHPNIRPAFLRTPRAFRAAHLALMRLPQRRDP